MIFFILKLFLLKKFSRIESIPLENIIWAAKICSVGRILWKTERDE